MIYRIGQDRRGLWRRAVWLKKLSKGVEKRYGLRQGISLALVNEVTSRQLNKHYRSKDSATDVLSFYLADDHKSDLLGELIFCYEVIRRQAHEHGHSIQKELAIMTIHGTLHLLGHDHEKKSEAEKMEKEECLLLELLSTLR